MVQIECPEDAADDTRHLGQFRKHLETQQREAVLDFAIACNILRLKEAEVKALMLKDPTNKRSVVLRAGYQLCASSKVRGPSFRVILVTPPPLPTTLRFRGVVQ